MSGFVGEPPPRGGGLAGATDDPDRRFDDLFNLVADPGFLLVAWDRVRSNKGARTAGVDGQTARYVEAVQGVEVFLDQLRAEVKDRSFRPLPVRERMIPKPGTKKRRRLGIPALRDRVVQAALKLVLEPIFEADFLPCSYGFRPNRRAHDAVAEVRHFTSRTYEWVVEGDIRSCFDEISHSALMERVRARIGDMLNRVALRHDEFIIERKGKPLAALVPVERLEQMRRFARRHALEFMDQQQPISLTDTQASELAADAKRWARRVSKSRRKTK